MSGVTPAMPLGPVQINFSAGNDDLLGAIIGERYEILSRLDHGGMGVVYKARHTVLENFLAVKILLRPQDEEAQRRFLLEAKLASKLNHPNTVHLSDFGVLEDGRSYLVMELLRGPTLAKALSEGRLDPLRACRIAVQIARGLCAVHGAGIVHRDLKPENIFLLDQDGGPESVKIVDFGVAQDATQAARASIDPHGSTGKMLVPTSEPDLPAIPEPPDSQRFTIPGTVLGTPLYMPPEQAQGLLTDARSDQYAYGCILYEMLTGRVPFESSALAELLEKHAKTPPQPPRQRVAGLDISERLEALVMRLLEKKRENRFASMREVEKTLDEEIDLLLLQRGEKVTVSRRTAALLSDAAIPIKRRRWRWLALPLCLCLGGIGFYEWRYGYGRARPAEVSESLLPGELARLRASAVSALKDLTRTTDPELRLPAISALGQTQEAFLEPALEALLASPDSETQGQAALALGRLGARSALPALRALAERSQAPGVQVAVATARVQLGEVASEKLLTEALTKPDSELAYRAAGVLCEKRNPKARELLGARATRWDLPRPQAVELWAGLMRCGDPAARDKLRAELAAGEDLDVPLLAASRLAELGDAEGLAFLRRLAERPEYGLRASQALALAGAEVDAGQFRRVLEDRDALVSLRVVAARGLGNAGRLFDARLAGGELATTSESRLRLALAIAILQLGAKDPDAQSKQSFAWAQTALGDSDPQLRQAAAAVLAVSTAPNAVSLLAGLLRDADPRVRKSAAHALGIARPTPQAELAALVALRSGLGDPETEVRQETLRALTSLGEHQLRTQRETAVRAASPDAAGRRSPALIAVDLPTWSTWMAPLVLQGTPTEKLLGRALLLRVGDTSQRELLRELLAAPDEKLRLLITESVGDDPELLSQALIDSSGPVRLAAAVRLARRGDRRTLPVLSEALARGGADGLLAYGLLTSLGETVPQPQDSERQLGSDVLTDRLAAVDAAAELPAPLAAPLLMQASRDPAAEVRRRVVDVAVELPGLGSDSTGQRVLERLTGDVDVTVRVRAQALLGRLRSTPVPAPVRPAPPSAASAPPAARPGAASGPPPSPPSPPAPAPAAPLVNRPPT